MMRHFIYGMATGLIVATAAFLTHRHYTPPPRALSSKGDHPQPQSWLLSDGINLSKIFEPSALTVLEAPDRITIHRAGHGIEVFGHSFSTKGATPTADDAKNLHATFHALNAYTPISGCGFQPGVLVRLTRGEHRLDLLICFSCEDMMAALDGKLAGGAGLSDLGVGSLRAVFRRVFPDDSAFKSG